MRCGIVVRLLFVFCGCVCLNASFQLPLRAQNASASVNLKIGGAVATPLTLTLEDLKKNAAEDGIGCESAHQQSRGVRGHIGGRLAKEGRSAAGRRSTRAVAGNVCDV